MKKNFKDKYSKWYKYYSNDFKLERKNQFISIFYQAREAIINPNINSMLEFGIGRGCTSAIIKHFKIKPSGATSSGALENAENLRKWFAGTAFKFGKE